MGSGKVDITFYIRRIGRVFSVRFGNGVIGHTQFHAGKFVGICPRTFSGDHIPPNTDIFHRFYPCFGIGDLTRFVQIESDARCQNVAGIVADYDCPPRRMAGRLHIAFIAFRIGSKPRLEYHILVVQIQVHARVVDKGSLVQVDVKPVVRFHHQSRLYAGSRERCLRRVGGNGLLHQSSDFGKARDRIIVFLRVVIARNPKCDVVASHRELRMLFFNHKIIQRRLLGKFVTESQTVVEKAETDQDRTFVHRLVQRDSHFIIMIPDFFLFAPYRTPGLIEFGSLYLLQFKPVIKIDFRIDFGKIATVYPIEIGTGIVLFFQFQPQCAGKYHRMSLIRQLIDRRTLRIDLECHHQISVWRSQILLSIRCKEQRQECHKG